MTRLKKYLLLLLMFALILSCITVALIRPISASADTAEPDTLKTVEHTENNEMAPYGLFTNLTLALDAGNGEVWAVVKNTFTLFPATVRVVVELYSSYSFQNSHNDMTLICKNDIADLNMGKSIETRTKINGERKYWKARMYYKIDNKAWQEKETEAVLLDENGVYIM